MDTYEVEKVHFVTVLCQFWLEKYKHHLMYLEYMRPFFSFLC